MKNMKNKNLYQFHLQLEEMKSNVIFQLLFGRIKDFYKNNSLKINAIGEKLNIIRSEFFEFDENGKVKQTGEPLAPIIKEGKTYEEYMLKFEELMNQDCVIKF